MKVQKVLKTAGRIVLIVALVAAGGTFAVAIHPQLIVGQIQKMMYQSQPVNTFAPLQEPTEGMTSAGQYKITDLQYGTEYPNSYLDITYPSQNVDEQHPTLFYFHGGGFFGGSKDMGDPLAATEATALLDDICKNGYNVVNVDYALVPQYHFPTPLIQANQAFSWAMTHADEYHLDMEHVIIMGSSAGAIMASQLGSVITSSDYANLISVKPSLSPEQVKAIVIDDAPLDYDSFTFGCKILIGNYVKGSIFLTQDEKSKYNNILHVTNAYPAAFLLGSEYRIDMNEMHDALDQTGVVNELVDPLAEKGKKMPHCFVGAERTDPTAASAFRRLIAFLQRHCS